jgi:diaminohydroxyphosphoribosylaminopyrimidine deaminase/5-amino-6-(5-phosphoribosylamino)uracil reductase
MRRCLQLASAGLGSVSPNPMAGCVVVHDGRIVGEGRHERFGGPHAEVNAIRSVADPSVLTESTLYVSLEPCCHHGKTPPCTGLILENGIPEVIVGMQDPFEAVNGKGIALLRKNGVKVTAPVLESACADQNRRFLVFHREQRPWVILKWAQSADGLLAPARAKRGPHWITGEASRTLVHRWRGEEDAVLVGTRTALADDPELTVRHVKGRNPRRLVIDPDRRLPGTLKLFDGSAPTTVFAKTAGESKKNIACEKIDFGDFPRSLLRRLHALGVQSLIVEGGAKLLDAFLASGCWDEIRRFTGPGCLGDGLPAPAAAGRRSETVDVGADRLEIFRR